MSIQCKAVRKIEELTLIKGDFLVILDAVNYQTYLNIISLKKEMDIFMHLIQEWKMSI